MSRSAPDRYWTTTNLGEAAPGVLSPLTWSVWNRTGDYAPRGAAFRMGILNRAERTPPTDELSRFTGVFYGRAALQVSLIALFGERMPGTTAQEAVASILGRVPEEMRFAPTRRRYPVIAWRFPSAFARFPRDLRTMAADYDRWWSESIMRLPHLPRDQVVALFIDARRRFDEGVLLQTYSAFGVVQPLFDALNRTIAKAGCGDIGILSGNGSAELAVVSDIWRASRGMLSVEDITARHGFHGPREGELESRVWREDDTPLRSMLEQYARRDDDQDPMALDARRAAQWSAAAGEVLAALPRVHRPAARAVLSLARHRIPMRGAVKRSFLQALDVLRASARRIGADLVARGVIDATEDVFYLTAEQLERGVGADCRNLVALRRARRAEYQQLEIPSNWRGVPVPTQRRSTPTDSESIVSGVGVSPGIAEGKARVLLDPDFTDVEDDEILIAPTTDPSWASIMFVSRALVMDIGGPLSHAAVVARELQIPCVVNTLTGTRDIRTGDWVRVDGTTGSVQIRRSKDSAEHEEDR